MAASPKEKFEAAVNVIQSIPKNGTYQPSNELLLRFYGFFKQATEGSCNRTKPAFWDVVNKAKWDAWNKLGDMPREEAMLKYVDELKKIIETMPHTDLVSEFVDKLGAFYEVVDEKPKENGIVNSASASPQTAIPHIVKSYQKTPLHATGHSSNGESEPASPSSDSSPEKADQEGEEEEQEKDEVLIPDALKIKASRKSDDNDNDVHLEHVNGTTNGGLSLENGVNDSDDSDGEEFCDTSDSPLIDVTDSPVSMRGGGDSVQSGNQSASFSGSSSRGNVASQSFNNPASQHQPSSRRVYAAGGGAAGRGRDAPSFQASRSDLNEQIAAALVRLQQDMNSVLHRLSTLETLTLAQQQGSSMSRDERRAARRPFWWPFSHLSGRTVIFMVLWPFIVHLIINFMSRRRARRR